MSRFQLLVGSEAFWAAAKADLTAAKRRALIQAMTFEGDGAGLAVAAALQASPAADRRVLVDDYTRHVLNDTVLAFGRHPALQAESDATWSMFNTLLASGVGVRVTNPIGGNPLLYPLRNHKKLLVIDDVTWLGGINFSDHNFAWHDLMLRIDDPAIADWLATEFDKDWTGLPGSGAGWFGDDVDLRSFDGVSNSAGFQSLLNSFASARTSLDVVSAYPTFPFVDAMAVAARNGADVTVYTPRPNNKPIIRDYLLGVASGSGLKVRLLPTMTHVKAALIDGKELVLGSSNFDFVSYRSNSEYVVTVRDTALIEDFAGRILRPAREGSTEPSIHDYSALRGLRARGALRVADAVISRLRHGPRVMEWHDPAKIAQLLTRR